jgi:hypothetical protein
MWQPWRTKKGLPLKRKTMVALALMVIPMMLSHGQTTLLSPEGHKLTEALAALQRKPSDGAVQEAYLRAFPNTFESFLGLFGTYHELADGYDFIVVLPSLAKEHEAELGRLLVQLSSDSQWDADAPNYLQHATVVFGDQHPKTLGTLVQRLSPSKRANLIEFLAHAENYAAYTEYQDLINQLKKVGQDGLAKAFEAARQRRIMQLRRG